MEDNVTKSGNSTLTRSSYQITTLLLLAACSTGGGGGVIKPPGDASVDPEPADIDLTRQVQENQSSRGISVAIEPPRAGVGSSFSYLILPRNDDDASDFFVDSTGILWFQRDFTLDHETKADYRVSVSVSDNEGNVRDTNIVIQLIDINDVPPIFNAPQNVISFREHFPLPETRFSATGDDAGTLVYSLTGPDASSFDIQSGTGELTARAGTEFDFETKPEYALTVIATVTDNFGNVLSASHNVRIALIDANNSPPVFATDSLETITIDENSVFPETTFTATAQIDNVVYSLSGADARFFTIGEDSGTLTARADTVFDYESKTSYSLGIVATADAFSATHNLLVTITNLNDVAPIFASNTPSTITFAEC